MNMDEIDTMISGDGVSAPLYSGAMASNTFVEVCTHSLQRFFVVNMHDSGRPREN